MLRNAVLAAALAMACSAAQAESVATGNSGSAGTGATPISADIDLEAAAKIYSRSCRACHGNRAQGASSYPRISDKDPEYISDKLVRYRAGEKFGPNSVLMIQHAKKLSDSDIASLAVYVTTAFK